MTEVIADEVTFVQNAGAQGNAPAPQQSAPKSQGYTPEAYGAPSFSNASSTTFEELPSDESLPF